MSQAITYDDLNRTSHSLRENVLHSLLIHTRNDLKRAINASKKIDMSLHPWLLLVNRNANFDCDKPGDGDNFFELRMDTRMAAKCEGNPILKKYYSVIGRQNEVANFSAFKTGQFIGTSRNDIVTNMRGVTLKLAKVFNLL